MVAVLIDDCSTRRPVTPSPVPAHPAEGPAEPGYPFPSLPVARIALVVVGLAMAVVGLRLVQGGPGDAPVEVVEPVAAGERVVEVLPGDTYERITVRLGADAEFADLLARRNGGIEPRAGTYVVVPSDFIS